MTLLVSALLLACSLSYLSAFPSGAPFQVCGTMHPGHGKVEPLPAEQSPYYVVQTSDTYVPGQEIKVSIKTKGGKPFKGFMVKAIDPSTQKTVGSFKSGAGLKQINDCAAITHSDPQGKRSATLYWKAPEDSAGQIQFKATVVEEYDTFYEAVQGHKGV